MLLETIIVGGILLAALSGGDDDADEGGANGGGNGGGGNGGGGKKATIDTTKKPSGDPAGGPHTFNHNDGASVRVQYVLLGYATDLMQTTMPPAATVKQFQRDYNAFSSACLNDESGGWCSQNSWKLGKLDVDGINGPKTSNALEWAKRAQGVSAYLWPQLIQQAHEAGY